MNQPKRDVRMYPNPKHPKTNGTILINQTSTNQDEADKLDKPK